MSKLAIFLCAALFASAANAYTLPNPVNVSQEKVNNVIDVTINAITLQIAKAKEMADKLSRKIEEQVKNYEKKVSEDVASTVDKSLSDANELIDKVEDVDVSECNELAKHLQGTAESALLQMKQCFVDKRETAFGYIANVMNISDGVLDNLNLLKTEALNCVDKMDSIFSIPGALLCTNMVGAKAAITTVKAVPSVSFEAAKLAGLVATLPPTLTYCTTIGALSIFYNEASSITDNTNQCIRERIDQIRNAIPEMPLIIPEGQIINQYDELTKSQIEELLNR